MKNIRKMSFFFTIATTAAFLQPQPVSAQSIEQNVVETTAGAESGTVAETDGNSDMDGDSAGKAMDEKEGDGAATVGHGGITDNDSAEGNNVAYENSVGDDETITDGDNVAGGDNSSKEDTVADGDAIADRDIITDGDAIADGDTIADGDIIADGDTIADGVYIGTIDVSGLTMEQAIDKVEAHIEELKSRSLALDVINGNQVTVTVGELGLIWGNPEAAKDAVALGKKGNVVQRYKALQDLRHENHVFDLAYDLDKELIRQFLAEQCTQYNSEAKDAVLTKTESGFSVTPGTVGYVVDEEASLNAIYDYLTQEWNLENAQLELVAKVEEPRGTEEELSQVRDVLGTFSTNFSSSGSSRSANVTNGCDLIAGTTLYPGDEFSTYEAVSPFSKENGYFMAGSYLNGQVVDSLGGGICQVSTTLYNAVLLAELEVTERHNHSMIVSYVDPSADAAIAESAGKDFKFVNNTGHPVYIDGYVQGKDITFTIYGVETRPESREVEYVSEVLSVIRPESDIIHTDVAMPLGKVVSQSAHIGYKAELWKVVRENGTEVSREQINSSSYKMVPRTATVGLSTNDVNAYNEMLAAVSTNNIDHVKNVAAALAQFATPAVPAEQQPGVPADQQPPAQPPAEQPPVEQPPVEQPPAVEQPPVEQPPVEQPPAEQPPVEQPPAEEPQPEG